MKEFIRTIIVRLLTLEARAILKKYKPRLIVVTGSVGKTSSKDALYAALKGHVFIRKSEKSYNSDIGVPLTILGVPNGWGNGMQWVRNLLDGLLILLVITPYPRWLVLEVGADRPGDISRSLSWLRPSVVVTTRFPETPVHVEFYNSPEEVVAEELFPLALLQDGGVAVINEDDDRARDAVLREGVSCIRYGFSKHADIRASQYRVLSKNGLPAGISCSLTYRDERLHLSIPHVIGHTHVYALLAGVAGAVASGVPFSELGAVAESYRGAPGRLTLIQNSVSGVILDDSYNASPVAVEEALKALESAPTKGRRIAVLGDMLELGAYSAEEHKKIGRVLRGYADMLVTVGVRTRHIAESAKESGMANTQVYSFEKGSDAVAFLLNTLHEGDIVLVKGSQSMRMERVVKALMAHPEEAPSLLPRQDDEWLARP